MSETESQSIQLPQAWGLIRELWPQALRITKNDDGVLLSLPAPYGMPCKEASYWLAFLQVDWGDRTVWPPRYREAEWPRDAASPPKQAWFADEANLDPSDTSKLVAGYLIGRDIDEDDDNGVWVSHIPAGNLTHTPHNTIKTWSHCYVVDDDGPPEITPADEDSESPAKVPERWRPARWPEDYSRQPARARYRNSEQGKYAFGWLIGYDPLKNADFPWVVLHAGGSYPKNVRYCEVLDVADDKRWVLGSYWKVHPQFPVADWKYAVANDDTRDSYVDWVSQELSRLAEEG